MKSRWRLALLHIPLFWLGCSDLDTTFRRVPEPVEKVDSFDHVLDVEITMAPEDWRALRRQSRDVFSVLNRGCLTEPFPQAFTEFPATVTIDGETATNVAVRKKGFIGSLSISKPSLKLRVNRYVPGQRLLGRIRHTFNNSRQDPALVRQCIAYRLFEQIGLPSPKCNYAHITLNGDRLGLFVHVEEAKKNMLARFYHDVDGDFFEGTVTDLIPEHVGRFERQTDQWNTDRSLLQDLAEISLLEGEAFYNAFRTRVNYDEFLDFWAMENLIAHTDGYAGNNNNYYIYGDPTSGLVEFLPWGVDRTFFRPGQRAGRSIAVSASGVYARRLYDYLPSRLDLFERMRTQLLQVWTQDIVDNLWRDADLLRPFIPVPQQVWVERAQVEVVDFVEQRTEETLAEIAGEGPALDTSAEEAICAIEVGEITLGFDTLYGTYPNAEPYSTGDATLEFTFYGQEYPFEAVGARFGPIAPEVRSEADMQLSVVANLDNTLRIELVSRIPSDLVELGMEIPIGVGSFGTYMTWSYFDGRPGGTVFGFVNGTIRIDEFDVAGSGRVRGVIRGPLVDTDWSGAGADVQ